MYKVFNRSQCVQVVQGPCAKLGCQQKVQLLSPLSSKVIQQ